MAMYAWLVCGLAALFYCYEYLLRIEPSIMVVSLMKSFHIDAGGLGVLSAMYYYAYTPLQAVVGITTDHYGPKRVLTIAVMLCAVGSFTFGVTHNLYIAGIGRFLIGAGSAFAFVGVLKLAAMWLPKNRFAIFAGVATSLGMLGAMFGDIGMSMAVRDLGWHSVVMCSAFIGVILIPIFLFFVHEKTARTKHKEAMSATLKQSIISFIKCFGNRQLLIAGTIGCMLYLSLSVIAEMWGIAFLQQAMHSTKVIASTYNAAIFAGWLIGAPLSGWLSDRFSTRKKLIIIGSLCAALTFSALLIWPEMNAVILYAVLLLFGIFSSVEILCFALARDNVPYRLTATAMGVVNMIIMFGGVIFQPLVGWILEKSWQGHMAQGVQVYTISDYRHALIIIPIAMLIAAMVAYFIKEKTHGH